MSGTANMGKVVVAISVTALTLAVSACGSDDAKDAGAATASGASTSGAGKSLTVGYSSKGTDQFQLVMQQQAIQHVKSAGLKALQPTSSQSDPGQQITDIRNLVSGGADAMLVSPGDSAAIGPAINFLDAKKIPVVALDSSPSTSKVAIVVRTDNVGAGKAGCEQIGKALKGKGTALALQGDPNSESGKDRADGFIDCMKAEFSGIKIIDRQMNWKTDLCSQIANSVLKSDKSVGAVYMASETICMAPVLAALKNANRTAPAGQAGHVFTVGIDGSPFALKMVRAGKLDVDLSQPLDLYAKYGVEYLRKAADGTTFQAGDTNHGTKIVQDGQNLTDLLPVTVVTTANATSNTLWGNAVKQ